MKVKKKLSQEVMKSTRAKNVTLKREIHGLLKAQGSVLSTMLKSVSGGKKQLLLVLQNDLKLNNVLLKLRNNV